MEYKSKCLINKCLLNPTETMGNRGILTNVLGSSLSMHLVDTIVIYGDSSLPGRGPLSKFFRVLEEKSQFLPESFGSK